MDGAECPSDRPCCLRILHRHLPELPREKRGEEQVDGDVKSESAIEAAIRVASAAGVELHVVHRLEHSRSFRRSRLECQKTEGVASGEENEQNGSDSIKKRSGHGDSFALNR